jgi:membrane protease YdiL (CAAX protease family)
MVKKLALIGKDLLIFFGFWFISILISVFFIYIKVTDYNLINLIAYLICFTLLLLFYAKDFKAFLKDFKLNYKKYLPKYLLIGILSIILMNIMTTFIESFAGKLPENESAVRQTLAGSNIIFIFLNIGIMTPLCEETIFRLNFRNLFKNKYIFSLFTGLLFGGANLINSTSLIEAVYVIPYVFIGFMLSFIYSDSNNLINSIIIHMINNIGTLLLLFLV